MGQFVTVETGESGVALVRLDRPKANALSSELLEELAVAVSELGRSLPGAVVVSGGPRIFAAGAEISEFGGVDNGWEMGGRFHGALNALAALPRVVIAAIEGYALGGGLELAMACDLRVASSAAKLGQPEIALGIIPGGGGTQRLPRLVGPARAKEMILEGLPVDAERALAIGLVDRVVAAQSAEQEALAWAQKFAKGPLAAQALCKRAIDGGLGLSLEGGLELERKLFAEVFSTEDARIGVESFLTQGPGKAEFKGR